MARHWPSHALCDSRPWSPAAGVNRNVVAIGLSSGFLEPLESTSLHLIQASILRLLANVSRPGFRSGRARRIQPHRQQRAGTRSPRSPLHYHLTRRSEGELWRDRANMSIPDTLSESIEHFRRNARIVQRDHEVFVRASWLAAQVGQLNLPEARDQPSQVHATDSVLFFQKMRATMHAEASRLPTHQQFIESNCHAAA